MIRKTILILIAFLALGAIADWQRFKDRARPAVEPVFEWIEDRAGRHEMDVELPRSPDLTRDQADLEKSFEDLRRERNSSPSTQKFQREEITRWRGNEATTNDSRIDLIEASLSRFRGELKQVEADIQAMDRKFALDHDEFQRSKISSKQRAEKIEALEAQHRRRMAMFEDRRELLEEQIAKTEAMRTGLN